MVHGGATVLTSGVGTSGGADMLASVGTLVGVLIVLAGVACSMGSAKVMRLLVHRLFAAGSPPRWTGVRFLLNTLVGVVTDPCPIGVDPVVRCVRRGRVDSRANGVAMLSPTAIIIFRRSLCICCRKWSFVRDAEVDLARGASCISTSPSSSPDESSSGSWSRAGEQR